MSVYKTIKSRNWPFRTYTSVIELWLIAEIVENCVEARKRHVPRQILVFTAFAQVARQIERRLVRLLTGLRERKRIVDYASARFC